MSHLLISYNLLAQMYVMSLNKEPYLAYHLRYLERNSNIQEHLSYINQREMNRERILKDFDNDNGNNGYLLRNREILKLKAIIEERKIKAITLATFGRNKNDEKNFNILKKEFNMYKINWTIIEANRNNSLQE